MQALIAKMGYHLPVNDLLKWALKVEISLDSNNLIKGEHYTHNPSNNWVKLYSCNSCKKRK